MNCLLQWYLQSKGMFVPWPWSCSEGVRLQERMEFQCFKEAFFSPHGIVLRVHSRPPPPNWCSLFRGVFQGGRGAGKLQRGQESFALQWVFSDLHQRSCRWSLEESKGAGGFKKERGRSGSHQCRNIYHLLQPLHPSSFPATFCTLDDRSGVLGGQVTFGAAQPLPVAAFPKWVPMQHSALCRMALQGRCQNGRLVSIWVHCWLRVNSTGTCADICTKDPIKNLHFICIIRAFSWGTHWYSVPAPFSTSSSTNSEFIISPKGMTS